MTIKSNKQFNDNEFSEQFSKVKGKYESLAVNLSQALEQFLREHDIKVLSVDFRVKEKDSFLEKIERKSYKQPFDEIEDICGIRIICYYQSDVNKICEIISNEFEIIENQDKEKLLEADQFGYRSTHFIVKIKTNWLQAPNYRGLENLKAEIQIRTVLMHAWAEIEHKLAYKKATHIPKQFKRKLSRISAKLEEADEQFEELKNEITTYIEDVVDKTVKGSNKVEEIELNLDSLQVFLDYTFPNRNRDIEYTAILLDELNKFKIDIPQLKESYEKVKENLAEIEFDIRGENKFWNQVGAIRVILDLTNDEYFNSRIEKLKKERTFRIFKDSYNKKLNWIKFLKNK